MKFICELFNEIKNADSAEKMGKTIKLMKRIDFDSAFVKYIEEEKQMLEELNLRETITEFLDLAKINGSNEKILDQIRGLTGKVEDELRLVISSFQQKRKIWEKYVS